MLQKEQERPTSQEPSLNFFSSVANLTTQNSLSYKLETKGEPVEIRLQKY